MYFARSDQNGNPLAQMPKPLTARLVRNVDGTDQLTFEFTDPNALAFGDYVTFLDPDGNPREYIAQSPSVSRGDGKPLVSVICNGSIAELEGHAIKEKRNRGATATVCLNKALEGTRWTAGVAEGDGTADLSFYDTNTLQAIEDTCSEFGLEVVASYETTDDRISKRTLSLLKRQGRATGVLRRFEYAAGLIDIERTYSASLVFTRVHGRGKGLEKTDAENNDKGGYERKLTFEDINNGKDYVEDTEATARWGVPDANGVRQPVEAYYVNSDCEDKQQLLDETKAYLNKVKEPKVTYEASVIAFATAGLDVQGIALGDSVQLIDQPTGIRVEGRVVEIDMNLLDPTDTQITLGNIIEPFSVTNKRIQDTVTDLISSSDRWDAAANLEPSFVSGVLAGLNSQMNVSGGWTYFTPNQGLFIYDRAIDDNPTAVIQLGGGFIRIANSKLSNGEWDWKAIGTGAGFIAEMLVAGILKGGKSWWNLETGEVEFTSGVIHNASDTVSINMNTGEVILKRGIISDGAGNEWDLSSGGGISITDGTIRISGYVNGEWCQTVIDASGFHVNGRGNDTGSMTDTSGNLGLRVSAVGPDDQNYLEINDATKGGKGFRYLSGRAEMLAFDMSNTSDTSRLSTTWTVNGYRILEAQVGSAYSAGRSMTIYSPAGSDPHFDMQADGNVEITTGGQSSLGMDTQFIHLAVGTPRLTVTSEYAAIVCGENHVMVSKDGIGFVPDINKSQASAAVLENRLMALADEGVDLSDASAYDSMPVSMEELGLGQLHDVLRLLCDGKQDDAKALLDQYESEQKTVSQKTYDSLNRPYALNK